MIKINEISGHFETNSNRGSPKARKESPKHQKKNSLKIGSSSGKSSSSYASAYKSLPSECSENPDHIHPLSRFPTSKIAFISLDKALKEKRKQIEASPSITLFNMKEIYSDIEDEQKCSEQHNIPTPTPTKHISPKKVSPRHRHVLQSSHSKQGEYGFLPQPSLRRLRNKAHHQKHISLPNPNHNNNNNQNNHYQNQKSDFHHGLDLRPSVPDKRNSIISMPSLKSVKSVFQRNSDHHLYDIALSLKEDVIIRLLFE